MDCPVCLETKNNFVGFGCAHHVCVECSARMAEFKHTECPLCRFQAAKAPVADCSDPLQVLVCAMAGIGVFMTCLVAAVM